MAGTHVYEHFNSIPDLLTANKSRSNNEAMKGEKSSSDTGRSSEEFTSTKSYEDAENLCMYGWSEHLDEIRKEMEDFDLCTRTPEEYKRMPYNDVVGFAPNVPNAIIGIPESMITCTSIIRKTRTIKLFFSSPVNCGVGAKDILKAGLCALKITNIVERTGTRVGIIAVPKLSSTENNGGKSGESVCMSVMIKDWRQPLDLLKVAFPLANPSMFRRMGFRWLETCPNIKSTGHRCGYGYSLSNQGWETEKQYLIDNGIMKPEDAFISTRMCIDLKFDLKKIARAAGLTYIKEFQDDHKGVA